jgi:hypothetical protein
MPPHPAIPAGPYVVAEGESVPTVALRAGFFWETLWNHPDNAELEQARKDPAILMPGDRVVVPELRLKQLPVATGARHVFRRRGVPSRFSVQLFERGKPRAGQPYRLEIEDGTTIEGTLDDEGLLDVFLDATVKQATLVVGEDEEAYDVEIGRLLPIDSPAGVQQRLANLGCYSGAIDGTGDDALGAAIRAFQAKSSLPITGETDDTTRAALATAHDQR